MIKKVSTLFPKKFRRFIFRRLLYPPINKVRSYHFFSTSPIGYNFGDERGTPIDRYYIEKFLSENGDSIKGRVLEVGDNYYTYKFGGDRVALSEIFHADHDNPKATYVGDLNDAPHIPDNTFDCIILTQTLQLLSDLDSAVSTLYRLLKKDGVVLVTVPGISKIYSDEQKRWPDYWRFTENSLKFIFNKKFRQDNIIVKSYGNVLSSIAFLHGLSLEELKEPEVDFRDEDYQMLICLKAKK